MSVFANINNLSFTIFFNMANCYFENVVAEDQYGHIDSVADYLIHLKKYLKKHVVDYQSSYSHYYDCDVEQKNSALKKKKTSYLDDVVVDYQSSYSHYYDAEQQNLALKKKNQFTTSWSN